jgi:Flp pilus assembly protein TadG
MTGIPRINASKQVGVTTVEVAIVGMLAMMVLFAVFEVARAYFVINALEEATRRGARVAAVCQVNDPAIAEITIFNASGGGGASPLLHDLTTANVNVEYIDDAGAVVTDPMSSYFDISFVRVGIANYQHQLIIPMFIHTINMPAFATTLPRESLGVSREGFTTC